MISKICLISPYDGFEAHGLRSISSILRANGVNTEIIFMTTYAESWQFFFRQKVSRDYGTHVTAQMLEIASDCDAVGISMMTMDKPRVKVLVESLKRNGKPIVLGGVHPTACPEDCITLADHIVLGEGAEALLEWCREPKRLDIENFWVRTDKGLNKNPVRRAVSDLDSLPFPDWGPSGHWVLHKDRLRPMDQELLQVFMGNVYRLFFSHGCPFSCSYCINHRLNRLGEGYGKFRHHSVPYVINEIKRALNLYPGIEQIDFRDDGFICLKEKVLEEFTETYKREINLPFNALGIIPAYLTERKLELLVAAGLRRTRLGFQSANKKALRYYLRAGSVEQYEKCHERLQKHKQLVYPYYDIITDNPFVDSERDAVDTIEFLMGLKGRYTIGLFGLRVYPGTPVFEDAQKNNIDRSYYEDSYLEYTNRLLNYILTILQCSNNRVLARLLLKVYRRFGNVALPRFLFSINRSIWYIRCGLESARKGDISPLPKMVKGLLAIYNNIGSERKIASLTLKFRTWSGTL